MKYILFFAILANFLACKTKPALPGECAAYGTVRDFTGLDGCSLLIELPDGSLLNPVKRDESVALQDGQVISLTYTKLTDMMSICMRENAAVEITCLKKLDKMPTNIRHCTDTENPFEVPWMDRLIDLHNPNQVLKYKDGTQWAYLFRGLPVSYLYDCSGHLVCSTKSNSDKCYTDHLLRLGQGRVIWQGEGVWD